MMNHISYHSLAEVVAFVNGAPLGIIGVDAPGKKVTVPGNIVARVPVGSSFDISGSTGNDGTYTVAAVSTGSGGTVITTNEVIPDTTVDGVVTPATIAQAKVYDIREVDGLWWLMWWS